MLILPSGLRLRRYSRCLLVMLKAPSCRSTGGNLARLGTWSDSQTRRSSSRSNLWMSRRSHPRVRELRKSASMRLLLTSSSICTSPAGSHELGTSAQTKKDSFLESDAHERTGTGHLFRLLGFMLKYKWSSTVAPLQRHLRMRRWRVSTCEQNLTVKMARSGPDVAQPRSIRRSGAQASVGAIQW